MWHSRETNLFEEMLHLSHVSRLICSQEIYLSFFARKLAFKYKTVGEVHVVNSFKKNIAIVLTVLIHHYNDDAMCDWNEHIQYNQWHFYVMA